MKCVTLLRKALLISNSFVPALVAMGELERFTGRSEIAKDYYELALRYDQHQQIALKGLVKVFCKTD